MLIYSFIISFMIGISLISIILKERTGILLKFTLGSGLGLAISSFLYFLWVLSGADFIYFQGFELILAFTLLFIVYKNNTFDFLKKTDKDENENYSFIFKFFQLNFLFSLFLALTFFFVIVQKYPDGLRDAFTIWNAHAKFLLFGQHWKDCLTNDIMWFHPDYPLLLPGIVARGWKYCSNTSEIVPITLSFFYLFGTIALVGSAIAALRGKFQALISSSIILGMFFLVGCGATQNADLPLGFYILSTIVLIKLYTEFNNKYLLIASGMAAGSAAWCKNEGLLFLYSLVAAGFILMVFSKKLWQNRDKICRFIAGLAPVLLIIMFYKLKLAPTNDIFLLQTPELLTRKLLDASRYIIALKYFVGSVLFMGGFASPFVLVLYNLLTGFKVNIKKDFTVCLTFLTLAIMLFGEFFIYIITPHNLEWHLETSINRLFIQILPVFIFCYFLITHSLEELLDDKQ